MGDEEVWGEGEQRFKELAQRPQAEGTGRELKLRTQAENTRREP